MILDVIRDGHSFIHLLVGVIIHTSTVGKLFA